MLIFKLQCKCIQGAQWGKWKAKRRQKVNEGYIYIEIRFSCAYRLLSVILYVHVCERSCMYVYMSSCMYRCTCMYIHTTCTPTCRLLVWVNKQLARMLILLSSVYRTVEHLCTVVHTTGTALDSVPELSRLHACNFWTLNQSSYRYTLHVTGVHG